MGGRRGEAPRLEMKTDAIAFGVAGIFFGLIAGWIIGSQQAGLRPGPPAAAEQSAQPAQEASAPSTRAAVLDEAQVNALKSLAEREPRNAAPRARLANLYFDAERYDDAIKWYSEALKLSPNDVNVSTDLGVCYYYTNRPDEALAQFDVSLRLNPRHAKTLLNIGIVKAFGKQDLQGASAAWQDVIKVAPGSPEAQAAKRALESLQSAHPTMGGAQKPGA
jgi:tetratricopeptide (TPR) repeat protein